MKVSIRTYFALVLTIIFVVCGLVSYQLFSASRELVSVTDSIQYRNVNVFTAQSFRRHLTTFRRQALLTDIKSPADRSSTREASEDSLTDDMNFLLQNSASAADKKYAENIKTALVNFLSANQKARQNNLKGEKLYVATSAPYEDIIDAVQELLIYNYTSAEEIRNVAHNLSFQYYKSLLGLWLIIFISLSLMFWSFYSLIYRPLFEHYTAIRNYTDKGIDDEGPFNKKAFIFEIRQIRIEFGLMKNRLVRQNQQRLSFLASVAHDLKNPLGALQMSLDALIEDCASPENTEITDIIRRQFKQLTRLINDLLDTSRIEIGELRLEKTEFDLAELLADSISLFNGYSKIHTIEFVNEAPNCRVSADKDRIAQVVNNLLSNAIKYSPAGGVIEAKLKEHDGIATVSITDKGVGIEPADLSEIFQPFRRSKSARHGLPGVGLGLSTSRKIVESHNGKLDVKSKLGEGSTFFFTLPAL
jgi:signal transduction histidine kinase